MRKPFLVCWKRPPLFYIISTQRSYIHQKLDTSSCFAKLRAISNMFSFFLYIQPVYSLNFTCSSILFQIPLVRGLHSVQISSPTPFPAHGSTGHRTRQLTGSCVPWTINQAGSSVAPGRLVLGRGTISQMANTNSLSEEQMISKILDHKSRINSLLVSIERP